METRGRTPKKPRSYKDALGKAAEASPPRRRSKSATGCEKKKIASVDKATVEKTSGIDETITAMDVLLFYPNLVGYLRVICMVMAFYYAKSDWRKTLLFYGAAFAGDLADGYVARHFNQCSKVGGVLDMVTDRVSTAGFLAVLCDHYPQYYFECVMLIVLDIGSHWFHVASVSGHHKSKEVLQNRNALLQWYYSIYPLFGYCCVGAEMFYILAYVHYYYPDPVLYQICVYGCFPACALKQIVNVVQLWSAMENIALIDVAERVHSRESNTK